LHIGCFSKKAIIGVCTALPQNEENEFSEITLRIRGMAVLKEYQGSGIGKLLVQELFIQARNQKVKTNWCNARKTAIGFYQKVGFKISDHEFEIEGIGAHYSAYLKLTS
jgi:N-acetylglutamate synthase-like GNAT family acetyltransferase